MLKQTHSVKKFKIFSSFSRVVRVGQKSLQLLQVALHTLLHQYRCSTC